MIPLEITGQLRNGPLQLASVVMEILKNFVAYRSGSKFTVRCLQEGCEWAERYVNCTLSDLVAVALLHWQDCHG